jgi:hypothetical protein
MSNQDLIDRWLCKADQAGLRQIDPHAPLQAVKFDQQETTYRHCALRGIDPANWRQGAKQALAAMGMHQSQTYNARMQALADVLTECADEAEADASLSVYGPDRQQPMLDVEAIESQLDESCTPVARALVLEVKRQRDELDTVARSRLAIVKDCRADIRQRARAFEQVCKERDVLRNVLSMLMEANEKYGEKHGSLAMGFENAAGAIGAVKGVEPGYAYFHARSASDPEATANAEPVPWLDERGIPWCSTACPFYDRRYEACRHSQHDGPDDGNVCTPALAQKDHAHE